MTFPAVSNKNIVSNVSIPTIYTYSCKYGDLCPAYHYLQV